jgi:hypothetical protein
MNDMIHDLTDIINSTYPEWTLEYPPRFRRWLAILGVDPHNPKAVPPHDSKISGLLRVDLSDTNSVREHNAEIFRLLEFSSGERLTSYTFMVLLSFALKSNFVLVKHDISAVMNLVDQDSWTFPLFPLVLDDYLPLGASDSTGDTDTTQWFYITIDNADTFYIRDHLKMWGMNVKGPGIMGHEAALNIKHTSFRGAIVQMDFDPVSMAVICEMLRRRDIPFIQLTLANRNDIRIKEGPKAKCATSIEELRWALTSLPESATVGFDYSRNTGEIIHGHTLWGNG